MTPHNEAKKEDIAKIVLMPGDPLRAKYIAENFMENVRLVNQVRGMFAYTGTYKGKEITVMGHGMGIPSVGIYVHELFKFYDVECIIRIGSCGGYVESLNLKDVIVVNEGYSESTFAEVYSGEKLHSIAAKNSCNDVILETAKEMNLNVVQGNVHSTDVFYSSTADLKELYEKHGCIAAEMESLALFHIANVLNKKAACILTVSDSLVTHEETTSEERQTAFEQMMKIALDASTKM
jgi:purine-nucleoside phosphorylase